MHDVARAVAEMGATLDRLVEQAKDALTLEEYEQYDLLRSLGVLPLDALAALGDEQAIVAALAEVD